MARPVLTLFRRLTFPLMHLMNGGNVHHKSKSSQSIRRPSLNKMILVSTHGRHCHIHPAEFSPSAPSASRPTCSLLAFRNPFCFLYCVVFFSLGFSFLFFIRYSRMMTALEARLVQRRPRHHPCSVRGCKSPTSRCFRQRPPKSSSSAGSSCTRISSRPTV